MEEVDLHHQNIHRLLQQERISDGTLEETGVARRHRSGSSEVCFDFYCAGRATREKRDEKEEEEEERHLHRLVEDGVVYDFDEVVEELWEISVYDQVEEEKEEVAPRENRSGNVVGEEGVEVGDHAGDEVEELHLQHHPRRHRLV